MEGDRKVCKGQMVERQLTNLRKNLCFDKEKNQLSVFPSRVLLGQILKLWYL